MQIHTRARRPQPGPIAGIVAVGIVAAAAVALAAPARKPAKAAAKPAPRTEGAAASLSAPAGPRQRVSLSGRPWEKGYRLKAGQTVEISVHLEKPSALPPNGRVAVEWALVRPSNPADVVETPDKGGPRAVDALEIYTKPTADWRQVLHALDSDVYTVYRAPVAGQYRLRLVPVVNEPWVGDAGPRWRDKGHAPGLFPLPARTPWPAGTAAAVSVAVTPVDLGTEEQVQKLAQMVEAEPNDTPEQAQPLTLVANNDIKTYQITGTADDIEYFDNGKFGRSGDDWFRVRLQADGPRLVTAQLGIPGQNLNARIRCYALAEGANPNVPLGALLPVSEYRGKVNPNRVYWQENKRIEWPEGQDPNERAHQQEEQYRTNINRILEPGKTYYFRVEANAPAYQLELRVLRAAPWADPVMAVRQGMYTQIGQVHAWLASRPRGASLERRIRDTGNLLGTQCMSCHTQSGIWGPAVPLVNGYRVEQVLAFQQLSNIMYECLRPTNELKDAANNTSLATLDIGDGPAGTRAAGFNIVNAEAVLPVRKLHSKQQIRTANYVLQTKDPGGINAAGPGSNYGQNIVWFFSGEILKRAWQDTGDPKYFRALEQRARLILNLRPKVTDDVAVRMDFFGRVLPVKDYPAWARKAAEQEKAAGSEPKSKPEVVAELAGEIKKQLQEDEARIRQIQNEDGSWGFNPGASSDGGKTWKGAGDWDPAPTALAITGLTSLGYGKDDPAIAKGVQALLRMQDPNGRWNKAAITGLVTSAYALRALGELYPVKPRVPRRADFIAPAGESDLAAIKRVQALALTSEPKFADLMIQAAKHRNTLVRYWAMVGLGLTHTEAGVPVVIAALKDPAKPVRDTASWALKQTLLDDRGWSAAFAALDKGGDDTRAGVMQALGIRADAVMPKASFQWERLTQALDRGMNRDPHPAVRAYAAKAGWQWWIWNPPVRTALNQSWMKMLERAEPNLLVEHNNRYASHALFIANGHKANGSSEHQYKELATLFDALRQRMEKLDPQTKSLMARRLVAVGGTFFEMSGGDGGPGQMGYITPNAGALFGQAVVVYLREEEPKGDKRLILAGLEGAANVPHGPLQEYLINYALKAPEDLRKAAAAAVSDPRSAMLQAATELVEPLISQVRRGAAEPARRPTLSDPVVQLFGTVNWVIPADAEQQRHFFDLMVPKLERYVAPDQMAALQDPAARAAAEREMNAAWYLADKMGGVLADNPDLHLDIVFQKYFPTEFKNPLERHFWVRSVPWILEHKDPAPQIAGDSPNAPPPSEQVIKDRALQLYLDSLRPEALPQTRAAAIRISNSTSVRRNPEVLAALAKVLEFEKDEKLRKVADNVVRQGSRRFVPELIAALKAESKPKNGLTADGNVDPEFLKDIVYFRDYVTPELARVKRNDQKACMGCHGVPGRVPSLYLKPVDDYGYIAPSDLLFNYRELQTKINYSDLEKSKILRKPLNVQDGTEDGHQGGRRYLPQDEGYLILKRWVENQPKLLQRLSSAFGDLVEPYGRLLSRMWNPRLHERRHG